MNLNYLRQKKKPWQNAKEEMEKVKIKVSCAVITHGYGVSSIAATTPEIMKKKLYEWVKENWQREYSELEMRC
jgi:hypothetical protein